jgi:hypothetical protein
MAVSLIQSSPPPLLTSMIVETIQFSESYRVSFDKKSNELMIRDGDEVMAKTDSLPSASAFSHLYSNYSEAFN